MADWVVPLSDVRLMPEEIEAVTETYRSGWLSQGRRVADFEAAFAEYLGAPHAIAVASGTAGLQLICAALDLGPGDEVVLPSLTFAATAAAVVHAGATPVFTDILAPDQPWLSPSATEEALSSRTRAIINVAYAGHPGEVVALRDLADAHGLTLIEDAAHAVGASLQDRCVGTFGHAAAFSFFANKNLPLGEGGMVITPDAGLGERVRRLRSHGLTADTWARHTGQASDYEIIEPGFNFRLDEPRAALGVLLLRRLATDNSRREQLASRYLTVFAETEGVEAAISLPDGAPGGPAAQLRCAWHIFPLLLDRQIDRRAFRARLAEAGVQTSIHYPPLHTSPAFGDAGAKGLAITEDYAARTVTIPLFPHMTQAQQEHVERAVAGALRPANAGRPPGRHNA